MKKKILLIGCGNIGFRHLQGLLKINLDLDIYIIEKSKVKILEQSKKIQNMSLNNKKITFSNNFLLKNIKFDLVICATTSFKRYKLLKKLILKFKFSKIIIEKLAFQNILDFNKSLKLFKKNKVNCWVNCPRREQEIYKKIYNENKKNKILSIEVSGNKWNLASNSIHFFDLFYFFNKSLINLNQIEENLKIIPSKHHKFLELTGKFKISNENYFILLNDQKKGRDIIVKIKTLNKIYYINESKQFVKIQYKNKNIKKKIKILLQNELTKILAKKILYKKKINLSTLSETYLSHKLLFSAFKKYFYKKREVFNCPIT